MVDEDLPIFAAGKCRFFGAVKHSRQAQPIPVLLEVLFVLQKF